jgi:hypothetical protein
MFVDRLMSKKYNRYNGTVTHPEKVLMDRLQSWPFNDKAECENLFIG